MRVIKFYCIVLLGCFTTCYAQNPFAIDFPSKKDISNEDYVNIQKQLRTINVDALLREKYAGTLPGTIEFKDLYGRCVKGIRQMLIDPDQNFFPLVRLEKIGNGGKNCIVTCGPYSGVYADLIKQKKAQLEETGFNGYYLYRIGGFPNPTGKEIQYVGVPYSFKIFSMREAYLMGFNNVLWLDSAAIPLRDPTPLFNLMEKKGIVWDGWKTPDDCWRHIFPSTRKLLKELTQTDVLNANYVCTIVFGLKMDTPEAKKLVKTYYDMAELGTPFLSCFPEEFVLTAILGQPSFKKFQPFSFSRLKKGMSNNQKGTKEDMDRVKKEGYYFFHQKH